MFNLIIAENHASTHDTLLEALTEMEKTDDVCNIEDVDYTGRNDCQWEKWKIKTAGGDIFWSYKAPGGAGEAYNEDEFSAHLLGMQEEEKELMESIKTFTYE